TISFFSLCPRRPLWFHSLECPRTSWWVSLHQPTLYRYLPGDCPLRYGRLPLDLYGGGGEPFDLPLPFMARPMLTEPAPGSSSNIRMSSASHVTTTASPALMRTRSPPSITISK